MGYIPACVGGTQIREAWEQTANQALEQADRGHLLLEELCFQGSLNFNNVRPGNRKSKSVSGAVQYGREGSYWAGLAAGGGREAWQTLALTPQEVEFSSYSYSVFLRKWLNPSYGFAAAYSYSLKRTTYQTNGLEMKFFLDF